MRPSVLAALLIALSIAPALTVGASAQTRDLRLIDAIRSDDVAGARVLLAKGLDVNARAGDGATALQWAVYQESPDAVRLLLEAGAAVNTANDLGVTPLWIAASNASAAMISTLLQAGADPNLSPSTGGTPLMLASRNGDVGSVKALIGRGANVNAIEGANGQTALMWAVAQQHAAVVDLLVSAGADVHARSKSSLRVVLLCCPTWAGDPEGTVTLDQGRLTPLMFAALNGDVASARRLLAAGARVDDTAAVGTTPLVMAVHRGFGALAGLLLESGADPNAAGAGYTALHSAVLRGDEAMVKTLLARRAELNPRLATGTFLKRGSREYAFDKFLVGATPFLLAARLGNLDLMRLLASAGADLSPRLDDGRTPLIVAASGETTGARARGGAAEPRVLAAVKLLIEIGADVNAVDRRGNTALHVLATRRPGFDSVIQVLAESGAALEIANGKGETPLMLALAPPAEIKGQSTTVQTIRWRADYAAWTENKGRTSTVDLLRKLGARQ